MKTAWCRRTIFRRMRGQSLRPQELSTISARPRSKENLSVFINAAKLRGKRWIMLLYGPPGLGKTTLAGIIANELGVNFRITASKPWNGQGIWPLC